MKLGKNKIAISILLCHVLFYTVHSGNCISKRGSSLQKREQRNERGRSALQALPRAPLSVAVILPSSAASQSAAAAVSSTDTGAGVGGAMSAPAAPAPVVVQQSGEAGKPLIYDSRIVWGSAAVLVLICWFLFEKYKNSQEAEKGKVVALQA